jgi:hypothetical protein
MTKRSLRASFNLVAKDYIAAFEKKQGLEFDGWVGDFVGGSACFGDHFIHLDDIRIDIDNGVRKGDIIAWLVGNSLSKDPVNFYSWTHGMKHKDILP